MKKNTLKKMLLPLVGLFLALVVAEVALRVYATIEARRVPEKQYRDASDAPGAIRMAILGGSTSNGSPYADVLDRPPDRSFNLLSVTRFLLEQRYGCPAVTIDNFSGSNWSAETSVNHYFERPSPKPDVLVLYTGQNETTQYYSPNMVPPPALLSPLARLQVGNLLLRRAFTRQVAPTDQRYTGKFFSDNVIPAFEREHSLARFRRNVQAMIQHAAAEGIFMVVVIPQSNFLFPPTRSIYEGPARRKAEALALFKQAWKARYMENEPERALTLLETLRDFCSFADLFYELGELHYARGEFETALPHLRRAREIDGFPICITPAYRDVLHELVEAYRVPHIDMDVLIRENLGRPVPDYSVFLDDCHLHRDVYLELSRQLIRVMRENGFDKLDLPPKDLDISPPEWAEQLGLSTSIWLNALLWESNYHVRQSGYSFGKLRSLKQARSYLLRIKEMVPESVPEALNRDVETAQGLILATEARMREWVQHEGPMPIGPPPEGDSPPSEFGGVAEVEASLGDALMAHGETELAIDHYRAAIAADPNQLRARSNLAGALINLGRFDEAVELCEHVLEVDPQYLSARWNLGKALFALKRFEYAVVHLREVIRLAPGNGEALREYCAAANALAWRLATAPDAADRNGSRARELAEEICRITNNQSFEILTVLAAAYADGGRYDDAVSAATRALELARQHANPAAEAITQHLERYREGRPWREGESPEDSGERLGRKIRAED